MLKEYRHFQFKLSTEELMGKKRIENRKIRKDRRIRKTEKKGILGKVDSSSASLHLSQFLDINFVTPLISIPYVH